MAKPKTKSKIKSIPAIATQISDQPTGALRTLCSLPSPGARDLAIVSDIMPNGNFTVPIESVVQQIIGILVPKDKQPKVFVYGQTKVFDTTVDGRDAAIVVLQYGKKVESIAVSCLANLFVCESRNEDKRSQYSIPPKAVALVLSNDTLTEALCRIQLYARRPLFSTDFVLLGPGCHREYEVLIHGPEIEPDLSPLPNASEVKDRLPPLLRELLSDFCFREPADLTNFLGLMLTGLLTNHFLSCLKGLALIDGNQPGVGKTMLMRVLGIVLDGGDPKLIPYTPDDEELQKRLCATLRPSRQSVLVIDNAKQSSGTPISSPVIEANSMATEIALRILGVSENFVRPNDVIWSLTMNQTKVNPDLMSRGLPIRLSYDGPPESRVFAGLDPIGYARENRHGIFAELSGFVVRWNQAGRHEGDRSHRCHQWAKLIGGILKVNGVPDFLANYEVASGAFNSELEDLTVLAETVVALPNGPFIIHESQEN